MSITDSSGSRFLSKDVQSTSKIGHDVLSYCARCKRNLSHTIVTLGAGQKPDRVLCNTCKTQKQFRSPKPDEGESMDREDDVDLDLEAGAKRLAGDDAAPRKKAKAKSKSKKPREEGESSSKVSSSSKTPTQLPLSMIDGTPEDKATYESRLSAQKNHLSNAKEYKASVRFKPGDIVSHKSFGIGFVVAEGGLNKVEVLFSTGRKLLVTGLGAK
jgi:hypothetical protein